MALGQAGVSIRSIDGRHCLVDPYLSDALGEDEGQWRVPAIPIDPTELKVDIVLTSHWHPDHLDRTTLTLLHRANPGAVFVGPPANIARLSLWGIPETSLRTLERGGTVEHGPFVARGCFARHEVPGWISEDAISSVIEVDGVRVFHSGDTEYDSRILDAGSFGTLDAGFFCINGTGGNMNALEAALLAAQLAPAVAIPMHFDLWNPSGYAAERDMRQTTPTLDPEVFTAALARFGASRGQVMHAGETMDLEAPVGPPGASR